MWLVTTELVEEGWDEATHTSPLSPMIKLSVPSSTQAPVAFLFYRNKNNVTRLGLLCREKADSRSWFPRRGCWLTTAIKLMQNLINCAIVFSWERFFSKCVLVCAIIPGFFSNPSPCPEEKNLKES